MPPAGGHRTISTSTRAGDRSASHAGHRWWPPEVLKLKDAIACYIEHRREVIIRRTRFLLKKAEERPKNSKPISSRSATSTTSSRSSATAKTATKPANASPAYSFHGPPLNALGIMIRSQAASQGDRYIFTDTQVERHPRTPPLSAHGLERDKIKADYDELLVDGSPISWTSWPASTRSHDHQGRTPGHQRQARHTAPALASMPLRANRNHRPHPERREHRHPDPPGYVKRTLHHRIPPARPRRQGTQRHGNPRGARRTSGRFRRAPLQCNMHDFLLFFTNTGACMWSGCINFLKHRAPAKAAASRMCSTSSPRRKSPACSRLEAQGTS
jgi:DNA gyrase subunit A